MREVGGEVTQNFRTSCGFFLHKGSVYVRGVDFKAFLFFLPSARCHIKSTWLARGEIAKLVYRIMTKYG